MNDINPIVSIIKQIPLFRDLSEESTDLLTKKITLEYYPANRIIFKEGDDGDAMYIIKKGQIRIYRGDDDKPYDQTILATLSDGSFFGEMALVNEAERIASAKTLTEAELFVLKKDDFYTLINNNPKLAEQISSEFINRIKENMRNEDIT
jgi:CRP/FNR family transcriptional regulator